MVNIEVCFTYDLHVGKAPVSVTEKVKGEYDGAVGGVFEGNNAKGGAAGLDSVENV